MARILAIDYGKKRSGIAVTDPLQMIVTPLDTVPAHELISFIKNYLQNEALEQVVIGLPIDLQGRDTDATAGVRQFIEKYKKEFPNLPIATHDERFTSKMAMDALIAGGAKKSTRRQKENIDKVSAAIILQSYLEQKSF